jgi:hypothetical protein
MGAVDTKIEFSQSVSNPPAPKGSSSFQLGEPISFFTPKQVAELLQVSEDTVLRRFANYPGVIDLGSAEDVRRHKRKRSILRIPREVLQRFLRQYAIAR